jgi:hypothetical protein
MQKLLRDVSPTDRSVADEHTMETTLTGTLFFDNDRPGVKTSNGSVMLHMPDFFRYAYFEGIHPDSVVKVRGLVRQSKVAGEHSIIHAREVSIGKKTYHIVASSPHLDCHLRSLESAVHPLCPYRNSSLDSASHPSLSLS